MGRCRNEIFQEEEYEQNDNISSSVIINNIKDIDNQKKGKNKKIYQIISAENIEKRGKIRIWKEYSIY